MEAEKFLNITKKIRKADASYDLNIIGNGRITLSLLKMIFDYRLDRHINKITVWYRERKAIFSNRLVTKTDNVNEEILRIHLMQKAAGDELNKLEGKIEFKVFTSLEDLAKLKTDNDKDVLILAVKYDLDELMYIDKTKKEKINPHYLSHFELLDSRIKLIVPGMHNWSFSKRHNSRKKLLGYVSQILKERYSVYQVIKDLSQKTSIEYTRLYNLEHSAIGVKYLSQVLRHYNGIILNMINEVDTTNSILHCFSDLKSDKILSPCENDTIRARYFLRNNLKKLGIRVNEVKLSYLGPHNHAGFIPPETVIVDGKRLVKILDQKTALALVENVTDKVNSFGEDVFLKKGSSDEDTVVGIFYTVYSLFKNSESVVRVSCFNQESNLFSGCPGRFINGKFVPLTHILSDLSEESKERLLTAHREQTYINQRIMSVIQ